MWLVGPEQSHCGEQAGGGAARGRWGAGCASLGDHCVRNALGGMGSHWKA